ncbi:MAG: (d)CMP kinase [Microscillaceae bacterium]
MNQKIIIAIDGYAGCGKSTTAKVVAEKLNYIYIDTGAMYRAVTLHFIQKGIDLDQPESVAQALSQLHISFRYNPQTHQSETCLNGNNVEKEIRKMYVSQRVSEVSKIPLVRRALVAQQQALGQGKGVVMDGRDIGTQVFPQAELKIFMQADIEVRAKRRQAELFQKGETISLEEIIENLKARDRIDTTRTEGPLRAADDAIPLDSSQISIEQQTQFVLQLALEKIAQLNHS